MTIAAGLRRARLNAGVSLRRTASLSGVGASSLSGIENGRREPTSGTLERIAETLGVRIAVLPYVNRLSAAAATDAIRVYAADEPAAAYRTFLQLADDLAAADDYERFLLTAEEPRILGTRWDDAVAALVEFRLAGFVTPPWTAMRRGSPGAHWEPQRTRISLPALTDITDAAEPFRRRGIAISEGELQSV